MIATVQQYQKLGYITTFVPLEAFQSSLARLEHPSVEYIYDRSLETEPREALDTAYETLLQKYDALYRKQVSLASSRVSASAILDQEEKGPVKRAPTPPRAAPLPPPGDSPASASARATLDRQRRRKALHRRSRSAQRNVLDKVNLLLDSPASKRRANQAASGAASRGGRHTLQETGKKHSSDVLQYSPWNRASVSSELSKAAMRTPRLTARLDSGDFTAKTQKRRPATEMVRASPIVGRRDTSAGAVRTQSRTDTLEVDSLADSLSSASSAEEEGEIDSGYYEDDLSSAYPEAVTSAPLSVLAEEPLVSEETDMELQLGCASAPVAIPQVRISVSAPEEGAHDALTQQSSSAPAKEDEEGCSNSAPERESGGNASEADCAASEETNDTEVVEMEEPQHIFDDSLAQAMLRRAGGRSATMTTPECPPMACTVLEQSRDDILAINGTEVTQEADSATSSAAAPASTEPGAGYYSDGGYYDSPLEEAPVHVGEEAEQLQEDVGGLCDSWGSRVRREQKRRTANFKHITLAPVKHNLW